MTTGQAPKRRDTDEEVAARTLNHTINVPPPRPFSRPLPTTKQNIDSFNLANARCNRKR